MKTVVHLVLAAVVATTLPHVRCLGLTSYDAMKACVAQADAEERQHQAQITAEWEQVIREMRRCPTPPVVTRPSI